MLLNSKLSPGPGNEDRSGHERQKLLNRERMSKEDPIIRQKCADYEPIYFELTRDDRVHKVDLKFHDSLFSRGYRAEPPGSVDLARDWLALAAREPGMPDGTADVRILLKSTEIFQSDAASFSSLCSGGGHAGMMCS